MLRCPHHPPDVTPTLPPISALITPYASTPRHLQSLHSHGALKIYLLCLILSAAYHAYLCVVPSQHASNATPLSACDSKPEHKHDSQIP
ncbi:hypothetical protein O181_008614 [Austropuccinia psidii MF-1]|uniref:Uncharacterized protein n=1 Tax=Austropuccinia psidii MF-1 TaxID=1389203 RepID=A0A9Q3BMV2_9BASI|nr:hypothetical protein [Austropuccinia psidii MF-1]